MLSSHNGNRTVKVNTTFYYFIPYFPAGISQCNVGRTPDIKIFGREIYKKLQKPTKIKI